MQSLMIHINAVDSKTVVLFDIYLNYVKRTKTPT